MATVYEIVQGLSQAAANAYDGALDENNELLKIGLNREEGDMLHDKRVMHEPDLHVRSSTQASS